MPAGVESVVEDGVATIEFVDPSVRGVGLARLLEHAPADQVSKVTRPRVAYIVPEEFARAAGLLDAAAEPVVAQQWPDGDPDDDWKRPELDAYAAAHGLDPGEYGNKAELLAAIKAAS
ncbi:Uncharacterised protein [Mycolicibacterium vanbaalenii]|uniref:Uncharacterized protein n=1 Tax=Mycolicibacterium vanbaalenii TaxID=110539 RepID=A0A5S9R956_MYCVN|nr:hypothetical protein [Mycolicibacterium vanbaalenii]CAA0134555.1 Uncharacterised protein [Mycolicibacterium vanbaalenii]